jgi:hypothetical protein
VEGSTFRSGEYPNISSRKTRIEIGHRIPICSAVFEARFITEETLTRAATAITEKFTAAALLDFWRRNLFRREITNLNSSDDRANRIETTP